MQLRTYSDATADDIRDAVTALVAYYATPPGTLRKRDLVVETIDGEKASRSRYAQRLRDAGFRARGGELRLQEFLSSVFCRPVVTHPSSA